MKVHNHVIQAYSRTGAVGPVDAARPPESLKPTAPTGDDAAHVTFSDQARQLAARPSEVDAAKVQALRTKIDSGQFHVDAHLVAERLFDALAS